MPQRGRWQRAQCRGLAPLKPAFPGSQFLHLPSRGAPGEGAVGEGEALRVQQSEAAAR